MAGEQPSLLKKCRPVALQKVKAQATLVAHPAEDIRSWTPARMAQNSASLFTSLRTLRVGQERRSETPASARNVVRIKTHGAACASFADTADLGARTGWDGAPTVKTSTSNLGQQMPSEAGGEAK